MLCFVKYNFVTMMCKTHAAHGLSAEGDTKLMWHNTLFQVNHGGGKVCVHSNARRKEGRIEGRKKRLCGKGPSFWAPMNEFLPYYL